MKIESRSIESITEHEQNARKHGERNLETIKRSLERFGQQKPIIVDEQGVVIAGNGTLAAARALGWPEISVVVSSLSDVEAAAYAIADNRTAELATWDEQALATLLESLQQDDSIDALVTGFDESEISALIHGESAKAPDGESEAPIAETWAVLIECDSELDQEALYNRLVSEGYRCRVSTL